MKFSDVEIALSLMKSSYPISYWTAMESEFGMLRYGSGHLSWMIGPKKSDAMYLALDHFYNIISIHSIPRRHAKTMLSKWKYVLLMLLCKGYNGNWSIKDISDYLNKLYGLQ